MKRTALLLAALLCSSAPLRADFGLNSVSAKDVQAAPRPAPAPARDPSWPPAEWTVMVFMNGRSNIEPFALNDLNRFETVGSDKKVSIVAELGRSKGLDNDTQADGDWEGVRRYYVVKDADKDRIASPVLMDLGKVDMGDYREVASFVKWARAAYPAKRYMLVIWDHGWGWLDPKKPAENHADEPGKEGSKSISHDFVTGNYIRTTEMGKIFKEAGRVDLYASMACFMQMAEVAYELKDAADVVVGSEEIIQLPSFNFEDFFSLLLKDPSAGPEKAGVLLVDTFKEMYSRPEYAEMLEKSKYGTQLSAIRTSKLPAFAKLAGGWAGLAVKSPDAEAFMKASEGVLRFEVGDEVTDPDKRISFYGDLHHFITLLNAALDPAAPGAAELKAAGEKLNSFMTGSLVIKNVHQGKDRTGKDYSNTRGMAADIPGRPGSLIEYEDTYGELAFEKAAGWSRFRKFLEKLNR